MNPTDSPGEVRSEIELVYRLYSGLMRGLDGETGLGGKLVWAGELDAEGCRLVRAANIAGAASVSATADATAQRLAIREGVIDFLVTTLSEALRILKNEIRKRNAVAVGVAAAPERVEAEMVERGVAPDLVRTPAQEGAAAHFLRLGARVIVPDAMADGHEFYVFADAPADFEARALELIPETEIALRRWMRLSPRYLGPRARRMRSMVCDEETAAKLTENRSASRVP
jgi:urocanate hydratase